MELVLLPPFYLTPPPHIYVCVKSPDKEVRDWLPSAELAIESI